MKRPQYVFRPNLSDPQHRRAWELLQQVPSARRKEFLVQAILATEQTDVVQICEPGGRILDPFAGAGTTVLAAVQEGYEAVGIEMSDAYFQRSAERLKTALESEVNQN